LAAQAAPEDKPALLDFVKYRFAPANHLTQSARLARTSGASEKISLACLLHDIAIAGLIRNDHGCWGAQLLAQMVNDGAPGLRQRPRLVRSQRAGASRGIHGHRGPELQEPKEARASTAARPRTCGG